VLSRARKGGKTRTEYVVPDARELTSYRGFLERLLGSSSRSSANPVPDGFRLQSVEPNVQVLLEDESRRRGAGAVVIRSGEATRVIVEVPHSFHDEATLPIGVAVFDAARARVLVVNTVHRYQSRNDATENDSQEPDEAGQTTASDLAHAPESFFLSTHEAFARSYPGGVAIQLHGFRDTSAVGVDAILSAAKTETAIEELASRLRAKLGMRVAAYPRDIRRLGGTKNAQAQLSQKLKHRFIHLELSQSFRRRLVQDASLMSRFASLLAEEVR
jgi:hypothetical protein